MSDDRVTIEIDGVALQARKGSMVIEAADRAGIRIPRFCYHKNLSVAANCRMCLVEVERAPKPLPACATPVMAGMKVFTDSALALGAQRSVMEFLLINHPLDCPICDQGGECELQDLAMGYGRGISRFQERKRVVADQDIGPLISTDMTRCIHCTRCVRFGIEIAGLPELGVTGRGEHMEIGTFVERSVDSELSGNVIDICPVGALTSKPFRFNARAWEMVQRDAISPHDSVGSNLALHVKGSKVMRVVPRENEAVNETWISDRDRFGYAGLYSPERLTVPRVKRDGAWIEVDWEMALEAVVERLRRVPANALGALVSPTSTVEEHYLAQKLMRGLGSSNIDHRLRQLDFSDQDVLPVFPYLGQPLADLERVDAALLVGSNPRKEQPLVNHRLRKAARAGAVIMQVATAAHPANYPLGPGAVVAPDELAATLAGIAKALGSRIKVLQGIKPTEKQRAIADALKGAERATVLLGPAALAHPEAALLRSLAGTVAERSGAAFGYLSAGANAAGAALAGSLPHRGPVGAADPSPGQGVGEMLAGGVSGFLTLGVEPELDCAASGLASEAMARAEFVIALSAFVTPSLESQADVLLPIAAFGEGPGTFVNVEGRWQSFDAAVRPYADARAAWRVLRVLGTQLELDGFDYDTIDEVRADLAAAAELPAPENLGAWRPPGGLPQVSADGMWCVDDVPPYAVDSLVRRSAPLQASADGARATIRVSAVLAARLGLVPGARAALVQGTARIELPVEIDDRLADRCVHVPGGVPGTSGLAAGTGPVIVVAAEP